MHLFCSCHLDVPSPDKYTLPTDFTPRDKVNKQGGNTKAGFYSFGIGRNAYERVYLPHRKQNNFQNIPGPGSYDTKMFTISGNDGLKYKLQGRTTNTNGKSYRLN